MGPDVQYFTSEEVSNILGVHVSSIKRWTDDGTLQCIKTAGGHRKFLLSHLADFLDQHDSKISKAHLMPISSETDLQISYHIMKGNFDFLENYLFEQSLNRNRRRIQQVLSGLYLGQHPLYRIYDALVTPVLHRIGDLWAGKELSVIEEHFASQTLRDAIIRFQGNIKIPEEKQGTALCISLSEEMHDIALKMVDHILEEGGYHVLFSGQLTPLFNINQIYEKFDPDRVYLSSTFVQDADRLQFEFNHLLDNSAEYNIPVYIGGNGLDSFDLTHPQIAARLFSFEETFRTL